jgi:hypothetical protein
VSQQPLVHRADRPGDLSPVKRAWCVPLTVISTEYRSNTRGSDDTFFPDSFLVHAANALQSSEASKAFAVAESVCDSTPEVPSYSVLAADTQGLEQARQCVSDIAARVGADLVVIPRSCTLSYRVYQPSGWRGRSEGAYARPVSYQARTRFHVQIWSSDGRLLYERIGAGNSGRPLLYTWFKRERPGDDIVAFAKRFYAPPPVRALYKSIRSALLVR